MRVMAGVGDAEGLADFLIQATLYGPGLDESGNEEGPSGIKGPPGIGDGLFYPSPSDEQDCSTFLSEGERDNVGDQDPEAVELVEIDGRCGMIIPFFNQTLFVNFAVTVTLPEAGDYYIVLQPTQPASGRFWATLGKKKNVEDMAEWQVPYKGPVGMFKGDDFYDDDAEMSCCKKGKKTNGDLSDCTSPPPLLGATNCLSDCKDTMVGADCFCRYHMQKEIENKPLDLSNPVDYDKAVQLCTTFDPYDCRRAYATEMKTLGQNGACYGTTWYQVNGPDTYGDDQYGTYGDNCMDTPNNVKGTIPGDYGGKPNHNYGNCGYGTVLSPVKNRANCPNCRCKEEGHQMGGRYHGDSESLPREARDAIVEEYKLYQRPPRWARDKSKSREI
eukprot:gene19774-26463_t